MPAAPRSRHAAGGCAALLPGGPVAGGDRRRAWAPAAPTSPGCSPRRRSRASSRSGSTTPRGRVRELEDELHARFGLREVRVAHAGARRRAPGRGPGRHPGRPAAAGQPQGLDDRRAVLGPRAPGDGLRDDRRPRATTGSPWSSWSAASPRSATRSAARSWSASSPYASAPATASCTPRPRSSPARSRDALLAEPSIADALDDGRAAPTSPFVGIGTPTHGSSAAILDSLNLTDEERKAFWAAEPGRRHRGPLLRRRRPARSTAPSTTGSSASPSTTWSRSRTWSASPHGRAKAPGVLGALRGRLIDSLVCDESLARQPAQRGALRVRDRQRRYLMRPDSLLILLPPWCWAGSSSSSSPTSSRWRSTPRSAALRRSGTVSVGAGGKRYRGGRAFVAIAVDDDGRRARRDLAQRLHHLRPGKAAARSCRRCGSTRSAASATSPASPSRSATRPVRRPTLLRRRRRRSTTSRRRSADLSPAGRTRGGARTGAAAEHRAGSPADDQQRCQASITNGLARGRLDEEQSCHSLHLAAAIIVAAEQPTGRRADRLLRRPGRRRRLVHRPVPGRRRGLHGPGHRHHPDPDRAAHRRQRADPADRARADRQARRVRRPAGPAVVPRALPGASRRSRSSS